MKKLYLLLFILSAFLVNAQISVNHIGVYETGIFDDGGTEIVKYDPIMQKLFSTKGSDNHLDIIDISDPANPVFDMSIDLAPFGGGVNSVDVQNEVVAVAVENTNPQDNGKVVFFDNEGQYINDLTVGALPDMVTFSPDGNYVMVANEGEPNDDFDVDPFGTISIIDISNGLMGLNDANVITLDFSGFNMSDFNASVRVFGNNGNATIAEDMEPEYIAIDKNSQFAYVALQENNAFAIVDIANAQITEVVGLGFKDHMLVENPLDASNKDNVINIANWPVYGMFQPDAIKSFELNGNQYIISANEGDSRDYDGYSEEERVKDITLDPTAFPNAATLQENENLGRLNITTANGDTDNDGDFDELYAYGARSFSIWNSNASMIYDSEDDLEQQIANDLAFSPYFNSTNDDNDSFDNRSDDKGPEPEAVEVVVRQGLAYAFIGLERMGGIMVYDITDVNNPVFVEYVNNRDFTKDADTPEAGDLGPEDISFISSVNSPNGSDLLVVSNEVSGTISIFEINGLPVIAAPTVATTAISDVTSYAALTGGDVTDAGTEVVIARGVCWNTTGTPSLNDDFTTDGAGTGSYISALTGLNSNTTYYVRAYATNAEGTSYGPEETFTTLAPPIPVSNNGIYMVIFMIVGFTFISLRKRLF